MHPPAPTPRRPPRVVIVGGGFAGLAAAKALRKAPVEVTLLDRTNHHLFQPLLYQVASGVLASTDIAVPIRWVLRRQRNATVLMAEVLGIDPERRVVAVGGEPGEVPYDFLVLAAGARHAYFGNEAWEAHAPGLKTLADALGVRRRFLLAFEAAERTEDASRREALQTVVVVGGGPTGVELAGILADTARHALRRDFRRIDPLATRVLLLEGGDRLLPGFADALSARAKRDLEELGVEVRLGSVVTGVEADGVRVGGERIPSRAVFWAAGNVASPLTRSLGASLDRAGRVEVEPDLSLPGHPEVFVVGDAAAVVHEGAPVPGVAPAANQQGAAAARNILRALKGEPPRPFRYRNKGSLATIGRHRAVASLGPLDIAGRAAWWLWLFVHILYLVGFRNRLSVLVQWAYSYVAWQRGARIVVAGVSSDEDPP